MWGNGCPPLLSGWALSRQKISSGFDPCGGQRIAFRVMTVPGGPSPTETPRAPLIGGAPGPGDPAGVATAVPDLRSGVALFFCLALNT